MVETSDFDIVDSTAVENNWEYPPLSMTTYIAYDSEVCQGIKYREPDPDVLSLLSDGPPRLADKLVCVESDLHPVVEQSEERSERERGHKDRDEAKL